MTKRPTRTATQTNAATPVHAAKEVVLPFDTPPRPRRENTKQAVMVALLTRPGGASLSQLMAATGWQPHSVRAALALMKRHLGVEMVSEKIEGARIYRMASRPEAS